MCAAVWTDIFVVFAHLTSTLQSENNLLHPPHIELTPQSCLECTMGSLSSMRWDNLFLRRLAILHLQLYWCGTTLPRKHDCEADKTLP